MPDPREQAEAVARWCGCHPTGNRDTPWRTPSGLFDVQFLPFYADSLDAMREVEDEIERRNLLKLYGFFLGCVVAGSDEQYWDFTRDDAFLAGATATALQRLQAAARVIEEVGK